MPRWHVWRVMTRIMRAKRSGGTEGALIKAEARFASKDNALTATDRVPLLQHMKHRVPIESFNCECYTFKLSAWRK